jgi:hypothetical protein
VWLVPSNSQPTKFYEVDHSHGACTCPDNRERGVRCLHWWAVETMLRRDRRPAEGELKGIRCNRAALERLATKLGAA